MGRILLQRWEHKQDGGETTEKPLSWASKTVQVTVSAALACNGDRALGPPNLVLLFCENYTLLDQTHLKRENVPNLNTSFIELLENSGVTQ